MEDIRDLEMEADPAPLTLGHKNAVETFLDRFPPTVSEHTFTNLYVWGQTREVLTGRLRDSLLFFIRASSGRLFLLGPPVGKTALATVSDILGDRLAGGIRIPPMAGMNTLGHEITPDPGNSDYLYLVSDLSALGGRRFAAKRNRIKKCLATWRLDYHPLKKKDSDDCIEMLDRWCRLRSCRHDPGLCGEYQAIVRTLALFDELRVFGAAIRLDGEVVAFTLAERLNNNTAVCHFEKAMPEIRGLGQVINQMFARESLAGRFEMINREQDLGIYGLRQAKRSYHPHAMVIKYRIGKMGPDRIKTGACPGF